MFYAKSDTFTSSKVRFHIALTSLMREPIVLLTRPSQFFFNVDRLTFPPTELLENEAANGQQPIPPRDDDKTSQKFAHSCSSSKRE